MPEHPAPGTVSPSIEFFIGYDGRERRAFEVAARSLLGHMAFPWPIRPVSVAHLGDRYRRPTERKEGRLWDTISNAWCSTEFSLARFWTPYLAAAQWAIFTDVDVLFRADVQGLIDALDASFAVQVVKHEHRPWQAQKMDGQHQSAYERKNWSSVIAWNMAHAGSCRLDLHDLNTRPGLWLHQLRWLKDHEIGELPPVWNHLVGVQPHDPAAKLAHFTLGTPDMAGYEHAPFADEWRAVLGGAAGEKP